MITIEVGPGYLNPVKNPIRFELSSDNQTQCGFKFVGSLYVQKSPWTDGPFEKVIEVRKYPLQTTNNKGIFDFSNILEDFLTVEYDILTGSPLLSTSKSYLRYYVEFEEEYEAACDGVPAKYNPSTTNEFVVFNGRLDFNSYKLWDNTGWSSYEGQFLSNCPVWTQLYTGMNSPVPRTGYTHTIRPNDNFPVVFSRLGMNVNSNNFLSFDINCIDGLKKTKLAPLDLSSYDSYSYQYFSTDIGSRQKDDLSQGNLNNQIVDDVTENYLATIKSWDGTSYSWTNEITNLTPTPIPDNTGFAIMEFNVTDSILPVEIVVKVNITHPYLRDLAINLVSPSGKIITMKKNQDFSGTTANLTNSQFSSLQTYPAITTGTSPYTGIWKWNQQTGVGRAPYISNVSNMTFLLNDYNSYGTWKVVVMDMQGLDVGTLNSASIKFRYKTLVTEKDTYRVRVQRSAKNNVRFYWLNKLGGWDSFSFTKNRAKKMEVKRSNFEKYVDYKNYNLYDSGITQYDTQPRISESVYSDFIDETTSEWLAELLSSPVVYRQENSDYVCESFNNLDSLPSPSSEFVPCLERIVIDDTTYSFVTKDTVKLVNYNIAYTLANQNDIIRF